MSTLPETSRPEPVSLVDRAYHSMVELISSGEFATGQVFSPRQLAETLGMSRLPVATAIDRLEREGVIESTPRVGTRLKPADAETFWGMFQWRVALECQTARLASQSIRDEEVSPLIEDAIRVDEHKSGLHTAEFTRVDIQFHTRIADVCRCQNLRRELDRLGIYAIKLKTCEAVRAAKMDSPKPPPKHRAVAEAIAGGDPDIAERTMREHLEYSQTYGFLAWYHESRSKS